MVAARTGSQHSCSDYWFEELGGLGVQTHAALQLATFGSIAGFYAMRSHVGNQAYILEKKKTSCYAVMSCQARSGEGKLIFLIPNLKMHVTQTNLF